MANIKVITTKRRSKEDVNMPTHIEPRAQKTKEYTQYIFDEIVKRSPLKPGELIEVRVIEGATPFPKITEIPVQPDIEGAKSSDVVKQVLGGWHYSSDPWKQIETWTNNKDARREMKLQELYFYTDKILGRICGEPLYEINTDDPLNITFRFVVMNPEGIRGWMQELGLKIPPEEGLTGEKIDYCATFTETPPQINWHGAIIPIEEGSYAFYICKVAFNNPINKAISWDEVVDEMEGILKDESDIKRRTIYDAVRRLNERIDEATHNKLFNWGNLSFYRIS